MPRESPYVITLSAREREVLEPGASVHVAVFSSCSGPHDPLGPPRAVRMTRSRRSPSDATSSVSGVSDSSINVWRAWMNARARVAPGLFPQSSSSRLRCSRVGCPRRAASRSHGSVPRISSARRSGVASSSALVTRPCGGGCTKMRFGRGNTATGSSRAIPSLPSKRAAFSISTRVGTTAAR